MDTGALSKLLALLGTLAVAVLALWLLARHERGKLPRALLPGYPLAEFPLRSAIDGPLASLCRTQSTLLALYHGLPASSPARPLLLAFLEELRALMDGAYALASRQAAHERLERLCRDAQNAAREMVESTGRAESSERSLDSELDVRLEVMRALARDVDEV